MRFTRDPGARQGHAPAKNGLAGGTFWGRDLHVLTQSGRMTGPAVPLPILRIAVAPANTHPTLATFELLRLHAADQRAASTPKDPS